MEEIDFQISGEQKIVMLHNTGQTWRNTLEPEMLGYGWVEISRVYTPEKGSPETANIVLLVANPFPRENLFSKNASPNFAISDFTIPGCSLARL